MAGNRPTVPTADELCPAEKRALIQLAECGLLYCDNDNVANILPEVKKHFKPDEEHFMQRMRMRNFGGRAHEVQESALGKQLRKLEIALQKKIGDDVIAATIYPPVVKKQQKKQRNNDDDGDQQQQQHQEEEEEQHPLELEFLARNGSFTLPISNEQAPQLYLAGDVSYFGREGEGEVIDTSVRRSTEIPASDLELPPCLARPATHFPELTTEILKRLAGTASEVAAVPFKLVSYRKLPGKDAPGDFFKVHFDSTNSADHFGTLSIHLPMESDYHHALHHPNRHEDPERYHYHDYESPSQSAAASEDEDEHQEDEEHQEQQDEQQEEDDDTAKRGREMDKQERLVKLFEQQEQRKHNAKEMRRLRKEFDVVLAKLDKNFDHHCAESVLSLYSSVLGSAKGGALRFYLGRDMEATDTNVPEGALTNNLRGRYGRPSRCTRQLVASILFQNYTAAELVEGPPQIPIAAASTLALSEDEQELQQKLQQRKQQQSQTGAAAAASSSSSLQPPKKNIPRNTKRKFLPMHCAAWLSNVLHDVSPLRSPGYRFVMTYKLIRRGVVPLRLPRYLEILSIIEPLGRMFAEAHAGKRPRDIIGKVPTSFVVLLRHAYPPGALEDPHSRLMGVDAACLSLLEHYYKCIVTPVIAVRDLCESTAFDLNFDGGNDDNPDVRDVYVFITSKPRPNFYQNDTYAEPQSMYEVYPSLNNCWTLQNGFGRLIQLGYSQANHDCTAFMHYRTTAIVCTLLPNNWQRRRVLFLAVTKGASGNVWAESLRRCEKLYPVWRNIAYFM